jgi:glycerol-1-phosphate dehydrogenase [NAD(P)+]
MLARANCPTRPAEIGLTEEDFIHGVITAQLIRKRYTILDFLYEAGLFRLACKKLDRMS